MARPGLSIDFDLGSDLAAGTASDTNSISERVDDIGEGGDGADELWIALDV